MLQRSARTANGLASAPPLVHDVLRTSGETLDRATREFMEPRFGHDFSRVRVHRDEVARRSAEAVHARAYTVGSHIVLGESPSRQLLAHELAHTIQQSTEPVVHRQPAPPDAGVPLHDAGVPRAAGVEAPDVTVAPPDAGAPAPDARANGPMNYAGKKIEAEKPAMEAVVKQTGAGAETALAVPEGARFVLHDSSGESSAAHLEELSKQDRGPLGGGIAAYVPKEGPITHGRPSFFEAHRPTATEHEKALDLDVFKAGKDPVDVRDAAFRRIYKLVDPAKANAQIDETLKGLGLTEDEIKEERAGDSKKKKPILDQLRGTADIYTAGAFTIEAICSKATDAKSAAALAVEGKEPDLLSECSKLTAYFAERNKRVKSSVNVEIIQPGVNRKQIAEDEKMRAKIADEKKLAAEKQKANPEAAKETPKLDPAEVAKRAAFEERAKYKGGPVNNCDPSNPYTIPLSNPPYTPTQYANVRGVYFRASLTAGYFLEVTTHKVVDKLGHCDPRCFDLTTFYKDTATMLGHAAGSTYGVKPEYSAKPGVGTVWWHNGHCHGGPPK
jgi:hypothetical protein